MDDALAREIAKRLIEAANTRAPIPQLSGADPDMTVEDAYLVQRTWMEMKLSEGRILAGRKVGLTSRVMQETAGINEPDYGVLFDDMHFADGAEIPHARFIFPRLEVELAFVLGEPLHGPRCTMFDVLKATAFVTPAVEIIDSRIQTVDPSTGRTRTVVDTISDNAAAGGLITGGRAIRPTDVDLRWVGALLYRNGIIEESGVSAAVLNHPANGVMWLTNKLATHGVGLEAGQVILAGSFTRPIPAAVGDSFHIDFGPLGSITCRFA